MKQCSIKICDIGSQLFINNNCNMSPLGATRKASLGPLNTAIPTDDIMNRVSERKRKFAKRDLNFESDENESSEEEEVKKPAKKIIKIVQDSLCRGDIFKKAKKKLIQSEPKGDIFKRAKKKLIQSEPKEGNIDSTEKDDPDYEAESDNESDDSTCDESSDPQDDYSDGSVYDIRKCLTKKEVNNKKKSKGHKSTKSVNGIFTHKVTEMTPYEKMIVDKRAENLAFLQSLKMNEVKENFCDSVQRVTRKSIPKKTIKNSSKTSPVLESSSVPVRKSRRLANLSVNLSEDSLYEKALEEAQIELEKFSSIPSELTFNEALGSAKDYDNYINDVKIQVPESVKEPFLYDRFVLKNLILDDSNIIKIVPERITSLSWYPSPDHLILAAGSKTGNLGIWNIESGSNSHLFKIHTRGITNLRFSPYSSSQLFSSSYEGILRCGDMEKQIFSEVYNVSDETTCSYFDFLSSTTSLVSLQNGLVALIDKRVSQRPCEMKHKCHDYSVKTVSVHPLNKNFFVTAENKGSVRLWDLRKLREKPVVDINHHKRCVNSAFFSPVSGNSILTTSLDNSVCIFDSTNLTEDIKLIRQLKHNNFTGRWLSIFRAMWLPNSDETFVIGSVQDFPRRIQIFDSDMNVFHLLMTDNLTTITSLNIFHPFRPVFAGGNSSGKVFVFK